MRAHAHDLRAEVPKDFGIEGDAADKLVSALASDWRSALLADAEVALCQYAEKLTLRPAEMKDEDIAALRAAGFDDIAIHDATQVIGYFNYINRLAAALDVAQEDFVHEWEKSPMQIEKG